MEGEVIGIHSRIGTSLSNNLHVPIKAYRDRWEDLLAGRIWSSRAYIGVIGNQNSDERAGRRGATRFAGESGRVSSPGTRLPISRGSRSRPFADLVELVQQRTPGEHVSVGVQREDERLQLDVVIGQRDPS